MQANKLLKGLSRRTREKIIKELVEASPELAATMVRQERARQTAKKRRLLKLIRRTDTAKIRVKLQNGLSAEVYRMSNKRAKHAVKVMEDNYTERQGHGTIIYHSTPIAFSERHHHYVAAIPLGNEEAFVIFSYNDKITTVLSGLKHGLDLRLFMSDWIVYQDKFIKPSDPLGKLLQKSIQQGVPPAICLLTNDAKAISKGPW